MARGVWAGIKLGAKAASAATRARSDRLAQSAPDDTTAFGRDQEAAILGDAESRSLDEGSMLDEALPISSVNAKSIDKGEWIHVIDLFSRHPSSTRQVSPRGNVTSEPTPTFTTVAHFRLPPSSVVPIDTSHSSQYHPLPVQYLSFSPSGTTLLAAPADGRSFHVFEFHPTGPMKENTRTGTQSQAWHLYELKRGHTIANVRWTSWDRMGNWVGVGTDRGTIRELGYLPNRCVSIIIFPNCPVQISIPYTHQEDRLPRSHMSQDAAMLSGSLLFQFLCLLSSESAHHA